MPQSDPDRAAGIIADLTPEAVRESHRELIRLVDWHIPQGFYGGEPLWEVVALALIARMRDILDSISALLPSQRQSESLVLLRVLYEHVVTFCWLAIDPGTRVGRWWEDALVQRRKLHNDAALFGIEVMSDDEMAEAENAEKLGLVLADRAKEVDDYWAERIRGFAAQRTFSASEASTQPCFGQQATRRMRALSH